MRAVTVKVAPVIPFCIGAADHPRNIFVPEIRVNVVKVAAVQSGVGDADFHAPAGIAGTVDVLNVHKVGGLGNVVVDRELWRFLNIHDGAQLC